MKLKPAVSIYPFTQERFTILVLWTIHTPINTMAMCDLETRPRAPSLTDTWHTFTPPLCPPPTSHINTCLVPCPPPPTMFSTLCLTLALVSPPLSLPLSIIRFESMLRFLGLVEAATASSHQTDQSQHRINRLRHHHLLLPPLVLKFVQYRIVFLSESSTVNIKRWM